MKLRDGRARQDPQARHRRAGLIVIVAFVAAVALVFARQSLFAGGFRLRAVVDSANQLRGGSEVRIAGIKVGQLAGISAGPRSTSLLDMRLDDSALPIHGDATITVKPRLLLEGNAYVDLAPGSPGSTELRSGATLPLAQTAVTPQLDQVLDVFDAPTRGSLTASVAGLAQGLGSGSAVGTPGYAGVRAATHALDHSLLRFAQVAHALRGTQDDLGRMIGSSRDTTTQLAADPAALADGVSEYARLMAALAAEDGPLANGIAGFDQLMQVAPPSLTRIDAALPPLMRLAHALRPAVHVAPGPLGSANRLLDQIGGLVQAGELPRLLRSLAPVTAGLPVLERRLRSLFGYTAPVTGCITTHVVPVLDSKIQDGPITTGDPAWLDLLHAVTGFTSASTSFDGNSGTFRAGLAFGATALSGIIPGLGKFAGQLDPNVEGVRPVWLGYGVEPPYRPDEPCATQPLPNLNAQSGPAPAWDLHRR